MNIKWVILFLYIFFVAAGLPVPAMVKATASVMQSDSDGEPGPGSSSSAARIISAERTEGNEITVDGVLDEEIWKAAPVTRGFTQTRPNTGEPASEETEIRVLYSDNAIYVGARMYDETPDSIAATLFRRDGDGYSDWIMVGLDSYNDRRTAFVFGVNPLGVRRDFLLFDGNQQDPSWDAVWQAAATRDELGWSAEIRIPLSQLRYNGEETADQGRSFGINFLRVIARRGEEAFWAETPPETNNLVSRFGRLTDLEDLSDSRHLELMPYISGSLVRSQGEAENPFYSPLDPAGNLGLDLKYGINSNLTLTASFNPDFGQVEVDPAVVNLSAFETFFPERRPFFQEGSEIFNIDFSRMIGIGGVPMIFYSRRIGRVPQGPFPAEAVYTNRPDHTPIAGAAKLSGRTAGGWSLGLLNALTLERGADFITAGDEMRSVPVEPMTNYFTGRIRRDFRDGASAAGGMLNMVHRNLNYQPLQSLLHEQAYSGALDFDHSWSDQTFRIRGILAGSYVSGTREVITLTQRSSSRYFQRPDAGHLEPDPQATTLTGNYADLLLNAQTRHWIGQVNVIQVSPGFEVNDLGFQTAADRRTITGIGAYVQPSPQGIFQNYEMWLGKTNQWNFAGESTHSGVATGAFFRFRNFWWVRTNAFGTFRSYDDRLTRGGPLAQQPAGIDFGFNAGTDNRKDLMVSAGAFHWVNEPGENQQTLFVSARYRPHPSANVSIAPTLRPNFRMRQYAGSFADPEAGHTFGRRYVFADMRQVTLSTDIRLEWTFTPDLSLQLFVQPFVSAGQFSRFKELSRPRSMDFDVYGEDIGRIEFDESTGRYRIYPDEDSGNFFELSDPDFSIRSLRGNAVLRWEFRPGSTLYLVWQQLRNSREIDGHFHMGHDFGELFRSPADHTLMLKVSYWMGY